MWYDIPGMGQKALGDLSLEYIYMVFILNKKNIIAAKLYWENKLQGNNIDWNMWFTQNFNNKFMPRKFKDFNWTSFHRTVSRLKLKLKNSETEYLYPSIHISHFMFTPQFVTTKFTNRSAQRSCIFCTRTLYGRVYMTGYMRFVSQIAEKQHQFTSNSLEINKEQGWPI